MNEEAKKLSERVWFVKCETSDEYEAIGTVESVFGDLAKACLWRMETPTRVYYLPSTDCSSSGDKPLVTEAFKLALAELDDRLDGNALKSALNSVRMTG